MKSITFVHGINTDGNDDIFQLATAMEAEAETNMVQAPSLHRFRYGPIGPNDARDLEFLQKTAFRLIEETEDGVNLVGHSNGCRVILEAMRLGLDARRIILFAPAAERWLALPGKARGCESILVIYNPRDRAIRAGEMLPYHPFGSMGSEGYQGPPDKRITNMEVSPMDTPGLFKHSGYFTGEDLPYWVKIVENYLTR